MRIALIVLDAGLVLIERALGLEKAEIISLGPIRIGRHTGDGGIETLGFQIVRILAREYLVVRTDRHTLCLALRFRVLLVSSIEMA